MTEQRSPRIAICTPCYDGRAHAPFFLGLSEIQRSLTASGIEHVFIDAGRCANLPRLRNMLAAQALAWGADAILWIDSDVRANAKDVAALCRSNKDIIGAAIQKRVLSLDTPHSVAFKPLPGGQLHYDGEFVEVGGVATAFMLVRRRVYEKLRENGTAKRLYYPEMPEAQNNPWFRNYYWYELNQAPGQSEDGEDWFVDQGEDLYFCDKAREAGFQCFIEPNVRPIHHEGGLQLNKNFMDLYGDQLRHHEEMQKTAAE